VRNSLVQPDCADTGEASRSARKTDKTSFIIFMGVSRKEIA
jgi:hypothetical protein